MCCTPDQVPGVEQKKESSKQKNIPEDQIQQIRDLIVAAQNDTISAQSDRESAEQSNLNALLREEIGIAKKTISEGLDSIRLNRESDKYVLYNNIASEGIVMADSTIVPSSSNLALSKIIFDEILIQARDRVSALKSYRTSLEKVLFRIDSLSSKAVLYKTPTDKEAEPAFLVNTVVLLKDIESVRTLCRKNIVKLDELLGVISVIAWNAESQINVIEKLQKSMSGDEKNSLQGIRGSRELLVGIGESYTFSKKKLSLGLQIFIKNHKGIIILFLIIFGTLYFYLRMLKKNYVQIFKGQKDKARFSIFNNTAITSLFISLLAVQFFYLHFPFAIYALAWIISFLSVILLIYHRLSYKNRIWSLCFLIVFVIAYIDNLFLQFYKQEPYLILLVNIMVIGLSIYGFMKISGLGNLKMRFLRINFAISILLELLSIYGFISDNINLSKKMMIAGILVVVIFILMVFLVRFLYQIFKISFEVYKRSDEGEFMIDNEKMVKKMPFQLYAISLVLGTFMFLNFFYFFQSLFDPFIDSLTRQRNLGEFTFSFSSIFIFFSIIYVSVLLSKFISFLLGESYLVKQQLKDSKLKGMGNSLLLFKIGIITSGLLLAFASTGISTDRLTIILSALGVGISFGLQTLVNNLVSGVIIALEKPINVGDIIEVSGKMGTMKSIGVRSSMMTTWAGSDVVIPNGDLLNQHLVNWTLGNPRARFDIDVGVAYGSDLEDVHNSLIEMLKAHKDILRYPAPAVFFGQFGNSSIDASVRFWVGDFATGMQVKSDIIIAIDKLFKEKGFEIPFPQQDVYIKALPEREDTLKQNNAPNDEKQEDVQKPEKELPDEE